MSKAHPRFHRNNALLPLITGVAYRVQPFYIVDQQICLWTVDYLVPTSTATTVTEANIAASWSSTMQAALRGMLAIDCFYTQVKVSCLTNPALLPIYLAIATANQPGTGGNTHMPSEIAAIISKATATKGQHGRGRLYLPGIPVAYVTPTTDANRLNATGVAAQAALTTALSAVGVTDGTNTATPAVTQSVAAGAATTRGQVLSNFTNRTLLGVVRRRRIGRGK
jgi:hypothetical protein